MEKFVVRDLKNYKYYHVIYCTKHAQNCISTMWTLLISLAYYPNFNT
jgi:hypothetical protein